MLLDDAKTIARLDHANVAAAILALPDQIGEAWRGAQRVRIPRSYQSAREVVVTGMGGSTLGAHLIQSVYHDAFSRVFSFINDYRLPGSVGIQSIVLLSSYSGTTEEVLACLTDAKKRKAKLMGIASGGPLAAALIRAKAPSYIFKPKFNPGNQPRMGLGYMATGMLALLSKLGAISVSAHEMEALPDEIGALQRGWSPDAPMRVNQAKRLAHTLNGKIPVFIGAEHLVGNAHIIQNQIQESAKQFCIYFPLPELNHHLMEGLQFPAALRRLVSFVFLNSTHYSEHISRRVQVTKQVMGKQGYDFHEFRPSLATRLGEAYETLAFGSAVSFYMAMLNRVNPSNIPWVDFFKKQLARG